MMRSLEKQPPLRSASVLLNPVYLQSLKRASCSSSTTQDNMHVPNIALNLRASWRPHGTARSIRWDYHRNSLFIGPIKFFFIDMGEKYLDYHSSMLNQIKSDIICSTFTQLDYFKAGFKPKPTFPLISNTKLATHFHVKHATWS